MNQELEEYLWRIKMNSYQPYINRAEHDFYKQLSALEADEKMHLAKQHQIQIKRSSLIDDYFTEQMKRKRSDDNGTNN